MFLAKKGRVGPSLKEFVLALEKALRDLTGKTKRECKASGHYVPFTVEELEAVVKLVYISPALANMQES